MRSSKLIAPFTKGMVTDAPAHMLGPQYSPYAQDGFSPQGVFQQRQGWEYNGTTADIASNLGSVARIKFVLADVTRTITSTTSGDSYIHNAAAVGTNVATITGSIPVLARCVYNDELILCTQDGTTGIRRYAGVDFNLDANPSGVTWTADKSTFTATTGTFGTSVVAGSFVSLIGYGGANLSPFSTAKVLERISSTVLTIEGIKATLTRTGLITSWGAGYAFPCVGVYGAGTGSFDNPNDDFDGTGTVWTGGAWGTVTTDDALLVLRPAGTNAVHAINTVTSATVLDLSVTDKTDTNINYQILRACPFKDAASHKGSFWGTGVAQFPSRVYVGPPNWNLAFPPGFTLPYDPTVLPESENVNDFLMDFVDVPSAYDGDDNVAILSSPNPLLVLKRTATYGVFGSFPNFSVDMIADGIGCIDIRSAQSYDEGQFWAGEGGIYWYTGGQIIDLTAGKINREWRNLTRDFDYGTSDYCTLGVSQGHLVVHITTAGGTIQRTYLCDLRDRSWQSRISNFTPRYMYTSRISGEPEMLLAVSDARQGRVLDFAPALDGSGTAKDDAGSAPRLQAYTPEGIDGSDISEDMRLLDLAVHANVYDAGAAGSTVLTPTVVTQDALTETATVTSTLDVINSDTTDRLDRHYFRHVDKRGRRHQVQLAVSTLGTDTNATRVVVEQIDASFRPTRSRT